MSDNPVPSKWKIVFLKAVGFGVGFGVCVLVLGCAIYWYMHRPKPWNSAALKGTFAGMDFQTQPQQPDYKVNVEFDIENTTNRDYEFSPYNLTLLCLNEGGSLSKEVGNYQSGEATIDGPAFIPSHGKGRVTVHLAYLYPPEFTAKDKNDVEKVTPSVGRRLKEINGLVLFDKSQFYRIDLPAGWMKWKDKLEEHH